MWQFWWLLQLLRGVVRAMRMFGAAICHTKVLRAKILRKFLESVEFCRGQRLKQVQRSGLCAGTPPWVTQG